jgi:tRNA(Ile)-lysidine synthase
LNHRLRGRSSDADARFVEKLAERYQLDFELSSANIGALARKKKLSIETAGRDSRYLFFAKVARRRRCHTIFLAHHADDLVETFLINLFRGAGGAGLAGMREVSSRHINNAAMTVVRPLLGVWRKQIDKYVRKHGIAFREDASNRNLNPLRNRIRHRVMPYLEKILGRNIRSAVWRAATITSDEKAWIDKQVPCLAEMQFSVEQLRTLPVALQRRAILKWLRMQNAAEVGFDVIERIRSLLEPDTPIAKVNLARDQHARRRAGRIFVE